MKAELGAVLPLAFALPYERKREHVHGGQKWDLNAVEVFELVGTIYRYPAYNMNRTDFDEMRAQRGKVGTMCFRPSPVSNGCDDGNTICCQTCGMPVSIDMSNCPYCGDPIPSDPPDGFDIDDPSYNTRII